MWVKVAIAILLTVITVIVLTEPSDWGLRTPTPNSIKATGPGQVLYYHDDSRGVGCWVTENGQGMLCLPDAQYIVTETKNGVLRP